MNAAMMTDAELLEAIELTAARARQAAAEDLRRVGDVLAGLALEAGARIRARGRDALRDRASHLEDAAFHFQTCSTCKRQGEDFCDSGRRFAAYLRGDEDLATLADGTPRPPAPRPLMGKVRDVTIHPDGRLTATLEMTDAGSEFIRQLRGSNPDGIGFRS